MANYQQLKQAIANVIKTNGEQAITGQVLQDVLNSMVSVLGANYMFAGVATPATNPGTPDQNVFYFATEAGIYSNFGGISITERSLFVFLWNGTWENIDLLNLDDYYQDLDTLVTQFEQQLRQMLEDYQPIVIEGDVTNAPDEEDLTSNGGLLRFKNRNTLYGMGCIYLRRELGFAEQLTQENTIYVIRYNYTLTGNVTIPANCVLQFEGGSISGAYTITGNNTGIKAGLVKIFNTNVTIAGTWNVDGWHPEWFGAKADGVTDCTAVFQKLATFNDTKIIFGCGNYIVTDTINAHNSTSTWVGSVASSSQFVKKGTTILYKGSSDIVILHLPNAAENICVSGDHTVNDDASTFLGTGIVLGGYGSSWSTNGRYRNITTRFFKVGIHFDASFGCVFDGLKVTNNYIGIDADPIVVEDQDSGYITLMTINSFQIVGNKKHAIYKESDNNINGGINIYFNNGYMESNGNSEDAQIKFAKALNLKFTNTYSEGTNTLIDASECNISLSSCKFTQTTRIYAGIGSLTIINSDLYNTIIEGACAIFANNSAILKIDGFNNHARVYNLRYIDYGDGLNLTGVEGRTIVNRVNRTFIKGKIDRYKIASGYFVYDGDVGGFIFSSGNYLTNLPFANTKPTLTSQYKGVALFDGTLNRPAYWVQKAFSADPGWIGADGFAIDKKTGTTAERPVGISGGGTLTFRDIGYSYFDTDLGKPIWCKAINNSTGAVTWVDATGATV